MSRNVTRRAELADAAVRVLACEGSRGLTHRAIDDQAGVPRGTTSNYFKTRDAIIAAIIARIGERLAPDPEVHDRLAARMPGKELFADYLRDILTRLTADSDATLALFELRLEAARRPDVASQIGAWLHEGFANDTAFNERMGLPAGRADVALFHYAMDGLILDRLTVPIDPKTSTDTIINHLVDSILSATL